MKIGLKEWIIDTLGAILIIVAIVLITMKLIETKQFLIMLGSGILMVSLTVKKITSLGVSALGKIIKKKFGS